MNKFHKVVPTKALCQWLSRHSALEVAALLTSKNAFCFCDEWTGMSEAYATDFCEGKQHPLCAHSWQCQYYASSGRKGKWVLCVEPNFMYWRENSLIWQILFLTCFHQKRKTGSSPEIYFSLVEIDSFSLGFFISQSSNNSGFQRPTWALATFP